MSRSSPGPLARLVAWALRRTLPAHSADEVIGDLFEHYGRRTVGRRWWLVAQALALAWGLGRVRSARRPSRGIMLDIWRRDLRHAARSLVRSKGFSAVALALLALGVGLTTAVVSVVDGVLVRPLPHADADRILRVRQIQPARPPGTDDVQRSLLGAWTANTRALDAIGPYARADALVVARGEALVGVKIEVSGGFFDVLRSAPAHGRLIGRLDVQPGAPAVAVLSNAFWRRALAGDPAAIGRQITIDDRPAAVVGVLPETFAYPSGDVAVYVPSRALVPDVDTGGGARAYFGPPLELLVRLADGASMADVEREAAALMAPAAAGTADGAPAPRFEVVRLQDDLVREVRPALIVLLVSVACVLAIVCVNLTNLLLARGTVRQREMAVRAALGASRWGMTRPLMLEGVLLSLAGGAAGLIVASLLVSALPLTSSIDPMLAAQVRVEGRMLAFTLAVSGLIGTVVGVLPAWQAPAANVKGAVSGSHAHLLTGAIVKTEHVRAGLVVVQVALAMVLAVAAALLSRSLVALLTVDLGFTPGHALSLQVRLPPGGGSTYDWEARFYEDFVARLAVAPGVRAAGFTSSLPMHETFSQAAVRIDGVPDPDPASPARAHREAVTPDYFAALGLPVTSGRAILPTDSASGEPVLVVNDAFAMVFLPGREALGQRVMQFGRWHRIVGVVRSKRHTGLRADVRPELYVPLAQSPPDMATVSGAGVVVRTSGDPMALVPHVRSTLRAMQPQAAIEHEGALADRVWASTAEPRFYATVVGVFAALAVATALVGLFGVLSYIVERRRVEIGVRRALGATARDISGLVLGKGLKLVAVAVPIGLFGAAVGAGLLRSLLFGIEPADPATFALVLAVVPLVALAACVWPALRAVRIEPLEALRDE